jgi:hypothetical protein
MVERAAAGGFCHWAGALREPGPAARLVLWRDVTQCHPVMCALYNQHSSKDLGKRAPTTLLLLAVCSG